MTSAANTYHPLLNPDGGFLVTPGGEAAPLPSRNMLEEALFRIKLRLRPIASVAYMF